MDKTYKIKGMDCASCATVLEMDLEDAGITAKCSFATETLNVTDFDKDKEKTIKKIVTDSGFQISN